MLLPQELKPTGCEELTLMSGDRVSIKKATPIFRRWTGPAPADTYGGKAILEYAGQPLFAELVILRILQREGWDGVWVDSYRRRFSVGYGQFRTLPAQQQSTLDQIREIAGSSGGCFDVFAWKRNSVLFAECKWRGHDRIRESQLRWLSAALQIRLPLESFLVVEWSLGKASR